jgi:pyruvate,water dikinase
MPDTSPNSKTILPLDSDEATLGKAGGKGANLSRLARAGYPVPAGFLVTTEAYHAYIAANDLGTRIISRVNGITPDAPEELESASHEIRAWFAEGVIPDGIENDLRAAYDPLNTALDLRVSPHSDKS